MHVLIQDGRVHELDADPALGNLFELVDVAGVIPRPEVGWLYDGTAFSAPPAVAPAAPAVRAATGYALLMALGPEQRDLYPSVVKAWDQRRLGMRGSDLIPEDSPLVQRNAPLLKWATPAAWFDAALASPA